MDLRMMAKAGLAASLLALVSFSSLGAQAGTALPTRMPLLQVNLKTNDVYYLDGFKTDIGRLQAGLSSASPQPVTLSSRDKLNLLLDQLDTMLFRQYCDQENILVSESEISNQITQMKSGLGPGATDAALEANLRRSGVFYDLHTYVKQELLFSAYLKAKRPDDLKSIGQPSVDDILKEYDELKFNLRRPSSYRFTMLFGRTQGLSDSDKNKVIGTMKTIASKLKADPTLFDEYIVRGAIDPKTSGYQTMPGVYIAKTAESKNQYPALYDSIFQLKEGDVSPLIQDDNGAYIVRVSQYLPEKQLGLDDTIEGLTSLRAAQINPSATVLQLVASEQQQTKLANLQKSARDSLVQKLRKDATITVSLAALSGLLDQPEIDKVKQLKSSGYNITVQ